MIKALVVFLHIFLTFLRISTGLPFTKDLCLPTLSLSRNPQNHPQHRREKQIHMFLSQAAFRRRKRRSAERKVCQLM